MAALHLVFWVATLLLVTPRTAHAFFATATTNNHQHPSSARSVASSSTDSTLVDISDLGRGMGGRIEDAFAASKAKGEAAFITFVTAGYPTAQGKRARTNLGLSLSLSSAVAICCCV
jgi:hypothetical protein